MKPLNIAIVVGSFPAVSETFIVSNIIYAIRQGFNVKIFCDKYLGISNSSQEDELQQYEIKQYIFPPIKPKQKILPQFFQLLSFLLNPRNVYFTFKYRAYKPKGFLKCAFILKQYEHVGYRQVFHIHFNNSLQTLVDIAKIGYINPSVIITFHGYDAFLETEESFQSKYGFFYKKYVKAVTVNSNYLKKAVLNLGVKEQLIRVVPIGFDTAIFSGTPKTIIKNQQIEIVTVGLGEGPERANLENGIKSLGIEEYVTFTGVASQSQVKMFMGKAHIFLMTSTFDDLTGRREAFGLVSIEAQAMGLPVVGFKSGGFPDTIVEGKTGFAVEDRNDKELADKILQLIENPVDYEVMSKAAVDYSTSFDQKLTTQKYLNLYKELLQIP